MVNINLSRRIKKYFTVISLCLISYIYYLYYSENEISNRPCWSYYYRGFLKTNFTTLFKSNFLEIHLDQPIQDAKERLKIGDRRFLSARGFAIYFPGIDSTTNDNIICKYGWRYIKGTADHIKMKDLQLRHNLEIYASEYNIYLLSKLKEEKNYK